MYTNDFCLCSIPCILMTFVSIPFQLVEQLYQTMTKRFGSSLKVWTQFGQFLMTRGKLEAARNLLQRSLKKLASKQQR